MKFCILVVMLISLKGYAQTPGAPEPVTPSAPAPPTPADATTTSAPAPGVFFYYCQKTNSYFPNVDHCDAGWIAVPVGPSTPVIPVFEPRPTATEETVKSSPNALGFELLGRALTYSLNYDRAITRHLSLGVGISNWYANNWWHDYHSSITVVPVYADYYFSQKPERGYISLGADWISVTEAGYNDNTFTNNGFAATVGGGYEIIDSTGFLLRLGGYLIVGRTITLNPSCTVGFAF